jgi:GNAT superfamily N-acetyltransferase
VSDIPQWRLEVLTPERMTDFIIMTEELHALSHLEHLPYDLRAATQLGRNCINDDRYFCQLAYINDTCIGCMAGYLTGLVFSAEHIGVEEGIYVREGTPQRAAIAAEMLKRFVRFCKDAGCADVRTGVISNIDNYAVDIFYRRNGFKRIGTIYSLRNPGGK